MSLNKNNSNYSKNSFLTKNNNTFIEEMYLKYINEDEDLPKGWKEFFEDLGESKEKVFNELQGPSWAKNKVNEKKIIDNISIEKKK